MRFHAWISLLSVSEDAFELLLRPPLNGICLIFVGSNAERAEIVVVGTWSMKAILFSLPELKLLTSHELGGEVMPRSVLFANFDSKPYLLCGLGDGTLLSYRVAENLDLAERKKLTLGTKPISLREFK